MVFLSHASEDKPYVKRLRSRMLRDGLDPWLDEDEIDPGQDWELEIERAVERADAFVVFVSRSSVAKISYLDKEIELGLRVAERRPPGAIFIIPALIEPCEVPERLARWQWVDLRRRGGYKRLLKSLHNWAPAGG
jgi:hypothetical protein